MYRAWQIGLSFIQKIFIKWLLCARYCIRSLQLNRGGKTQFQHSRSSVTIVVCEGGLVGRENGREGHEADGQTRKAAIMPQCGRCCGGVGL